MCGRHVSRPLSLIVKDEFEQFDFNDLLTFC
jgi:hypothetical protein